MHFSRTTIIGVALALVGVVGLGFYVARDFKQKSASDLTTDNAANGNGSTTRTVGGITFEGEGDIVVEEVPLAEAGPAPSLERPITIPPSFSSEAAALMQKEIRTLIAGIKGKPGDMSLWLDLGLRWQEIGDYEGARAAYEYVARLAPSSSTAYANLGNLYHYYLKDFPKSEQYFLQAIKLDPKYVLFYANLHDLYRYSYKKDTGAAADILKQGIKANPEAVDLYVALAAYYKTQGNRAQAKVYYEQALDLAIDAGNTALREAIGKELAEL